MTKIKTEGFVIVNSVNNEIVDVALYEDTCERFVQTKKEYEKLGHGYRKYKADDLRIMPAVIFVKKTSAG